MPEPPIAANKQRHKKGFAAISSVIDALAQNQVTQAFCFALLCGLNGFFFTVLFLGAMFSAGRTTMLLCGGFAGVGLTLLCLQNQIKWARAKARSETVRPHEKIANSKASKNSISWIALFPGASLVTYDAGLLLGISQNWWLIPALFSGALLTFLLVVVQNQSKR